jgi:uncharacterized protein (DUF983 family)
MPLPRCPRCKIGKLYIDIWEEPNDLACVGCGARLVGPLTKELVVQWIQRFKEQSVERT